MKTNQLWKLIVAQFKVSPAKSAVLGLLTLVFLVAVVRLVGKKPESADAAVAAVPSGENVNTSLIPPPVIEREQLTAQPMPPAPQLPTTPARDPFSADWSLFAVNPEEQEADDYSEPQSEPEREQPWTLSLTLTRTASGEPFAVINDQRVGIGDRIMGYTVVSISAREVVLSGEDDRQIVLGMN